jgi:adenosylhomocysteinase
VFGYGPCGRGIARSFASLGAHVAVVEPDEIRALEAAMAGYAVVPTEQALRWGTVVVTATGATDVVTADVLPVLADGVVLANAGHFDREIDVPALRAAAVRREEPEDGVERLTLEDGRRVVLLAAGRMVNLAGRAPKGNSIESMDLGFALQALSLRAVAEGHATLPRGAQPVPDAIDRELAGRLVRRLAPPWAAAAAG